MQNTNTYPVIPFLNRGGDGANIITTTTSIQKLSSSLSSSKNMIGSLVNFVKDSIVSTVVATKELYSNHQQCNMIRQKQKNYRDSIFQQWSNELLEQKKKKRTFESSSSDINTLSKEEINKSNNVSIKKYIRMPVLIYKSFCFSIMVKMIVPNY